MTPEEKQKLFEIKCRSKRGQAINSKDHEFCEEMYRLYPDEYGDDEKEFSRKQVHLGVNNAIFKIR